MRILAGWAVLLLVLAGCSDTDEQTASGPTPDETARQTSPPQVPLPPPPPAGTEGAPAEDGQSPAPLPGNRQESPGAPAGRAMGGSRTVLPDGATAVRPAADEPLPGQPTIRLSTGVALPQTTPVGPATGFSVDYRFTEGGPDPDARYIWVIERAGGAPARQPVRLSDRGTLQMLVPDWRAQDAPFRARLEDAHGNRLSTSITLR